MLNSAPCNRTLCKSEKQTISHLLFRCTESSAFWQEFTSWWLLKFKQVITLTECVVLYGYHNNIKNKQTLNVTLLLAKYHIFATSSCVGKLSFESFLLRLQNHLEILKQSYTGKHITSICIYLRQSVVTHCFAPFPTILHQLTKIDVFAFFPVVCCCSPCRACAVNLYKCTEKYEKKGIDCTFSTDV